MKLIQTIQQDTAGKTSSGLHEDAAGGAVCAGDMASAVMPLLSTMVQRQPTTSIPKPQLIDYGIKKPKAKKKKSIGLAEAYRSMMEDVPTSNTGDIAQGGDHKSDPNFDSSEVISKLKGLENKEKQDHRDTVTFGLEDDDGGLVKVTVRQEQAGDFENALQAFISNIDDTAEKPEIAEILFKLKDQFDVVDVEWPQVQEDEEEDVSMQGAGGEGDDQGLTGDEAADPNADPGADLGGEDPLGGMDDSGTGGDGQVQGLLTQVIDMMKADAEARKAEARAKEAEAKAKEADAIVAQAMSKVKQEEQYLDMETYNKSKKDEDREAKRLAQLAKWKHDMSSEHGVDAGDDDDSGGDLLSAMTRSQPKAAAQQAPQQGLEQEERAGPATSQKQQPKKGSTIRGKVHPHDVARFILNRVK